MNEQAPALQSRLFRDFDVDSDRNSQFKRDLPRLFALSNQTIALCLERLHELELEPTAPIFGKILREIDAATPDDPLLDIKRGIFCLRFFLGQMQDEDIRDDTPESWLRDLQSLGLVSEEESTGEAQRFSFVINHLRDEVLPLVEPRGREFRARRGVLPCYSGMDTTVEVRAVVKKDYDSSMVIGDYRPEILGHVGIVSIVIKVDVGKDRNFYFQADRDQLHRIKNYLSAALAKLDALEQQIRGSK